MAATCCVLLVGPQRSAENRLGLAWLLRHDEMWQLASCRSEDRFVLRGADYQGAFLCAQRQNVTLREQAA